MSEDRPSAQEPDDLLLRDQVRALDLALLNLDRYRMTAMNNAEVILRLGPLVGRGLVDFDCLPDRVRFLFQSWLAVILEVHKGKPVAEVRAALKSAFFTAYFVSRFYEYGELPTPKGAQDADRIDP